MALPKQLHAQATNLLKFFSRTKHHRPPTHSCAWEMFFKHCRIIRATTNCFTRLFVRRQYLPPKTAGKFSVCVTHQNHQAKHEGHLHKANLNHSLKEWCADVKVIWVNSWRPVIGDWRRPFLVIVFGTGDAMDFLFDKLVPSNDMTSSAHFFLHGWKKIGGNDKDGWCWVISIEQGWLVVRFFLRQWSQLKTFEKLV